MELKNKLPEMSEEEQLQLLDTNGESYNIINNSFGDYGLNKIYVTQNYICLSEEGNNYQFIYSSVIYFCKRLVGFSGIVYANFPLSIIGFKIFLVRYVRFLYPT